MSSRILTRVRLCLLAALAGITLVGCPAYFVVLSTVFFTHGTWMHDVVISITVRDATTAVTHHQEHMAGAAVGAVEYAWGVDIDVDNDPATGDAEGYDVTLVAELDTGGESGTDPVDTQLIDLLELTEVNPPYEILESEDPEGILRKVGINERTIYLESESSEHIWWWNVYDPQGEIVKYIDAEYRARFFTRFNNPPDPGTEIGDTVMLVGNGSAEDEANDVEPGCIDIISVRMEHPRAGEESR
jgi:hypothetical protein